jgi:hypothetical protein
VTVTGQLGSSTRGVKGLTGHVDRNELNIGSVGGDLRVLLTFVD